MNDQIKQKLIEELEDMLGTMVADEDGLHEVSLEAVIDFIKMFPSQPPADSGPDTNVGTNQWIPCSSGRMPKHKQRCLITIRIDKGRRCTTTANYYTEAGIVDECEWADEGFYTYDSEYGHFRHGNVIAWMPAEPYEGE